MARSNLDVVITVRDAASGKLRNVEKGIKSTGKAARETGADFTKFNRIMFGTTAFIGLFERAFSRLGNTISEGARLDRLSSQFERVVGPRGELFKMINEFTDNSIDRFEAMRSSIALANTGIIKDSSTLARVMSMAGTAAKQAGLDSAEGMKRYTQFLKTGNIEQLSFLNLIAASNPRLQAQLAVLQKSAGTMSQVVGTQYKLALGQRLLTAATEGFLKGNRSLIDTVNDLQQSFKFLRDEVGALFGQALAPLMDSFSSLFFNLSETVNNIRKTDKNILFLIKSFTVLTGVAAGLIATLGTLRLVLLALGSIGGLGIPFVTAAMTGLGLAFMSVTSGADKFVDKFRLFGAFLKGTFQLVHSFLTDPENFAAGIGKMDKSVHDMLKKHGLLNLAENIARVSAVTVRFVKDAGSLFVDWLKTAFNWVSKLVGSITGLLGLDMRRLGLTSRSLLEGDSPARQLAVGLGAGALMLGTAGLAFKAGRSLFGGPGRGPKGTPSDPIYTVSAGGGLGGMFGLGGKAGSKGFGLKGLGILGALLGAGGLLSALFTGGSAIDKAGSAGSFVGGVGGGLLGTKLGALIGTLLFPGIGTTIGAGVGGLAGALGLGALFEKLGITIAEAITGEKSRTDVAIPYMPASRLDQIDLLGQELVKLEGDKQKRFKTSVEQALSSASAGGADITKEEWVQIFRLALDTSDTSANLKERKSAESFGSQFSRRPAMQGRQY